jgi:hypothetical protein
MVQGICESRSAWYNPSVASSLFPARLPPPSFEARCAWTEDAFVKEDQDYAFDGGSSACAVIPAVSLMPIAVVPNIDLHPSEFIRSFARLFVHAMRRNVRISFFLFDHGSCRQLEFQHSRRI